MRNEPTEPERRLWNELKGKRLEGFKFRRQATMGRYIVDFYCPGEKLVVEIDGDTHEPQVDAVRDRWLAENFGVTIVRLSNHDVMRNLDGGLMRLIGTLRGSNHPPTPSLAKEGE